MRTIRTRTKFLIAVAAVLLLQATTPRMVYAQSQTDCVGQMEQAVAQYSSLLVSCMQSMYNNPVVWMVGPWGYGMGGSVCAVEYAARIAGAQTQMLACMAIRAEKGPISGGGD